MKIVHAILSVSIAANLTLFGIVVLKRTGSTETTTAKAESEHEVSTSAAGRGAAKASTDSRIASTASQSRLWEELRNASLPEMAKRLRSAGFPRKLVVAIVSGAAHERTQARFQELTPEARANQPYWKPFQDIHDDPKKREAVMKFQREQHAILVEALGEKYWLTDEAFSEMTRQQYGELPDNKLRAMAAIENDYAELQVKLYQEAGVGGGEGKLDMKKVQMLEAEQRADIEKLLTPEELLEFDLRRSPAAHKLREDTAILQLSEAEFRALYPGYQAAIEQSKFSEAASITGREAAWSAVEALAEAKVKDVLGPDRFADYLQAKDPASKQLNLIVQRLELPLSAARAIVAVQDDIGQRADAIRTNQALTSEQRAVQFAALSQEATTKITGSLGQRGYAAYLENSGKWLPTLQKSAQIENPPPSKK